MAGAYSRRLRFETAEIRLVVILPGSPSDKIQCCLIYASLADFSSRGESLYLRKNTPNTAAWLESKGRHDEALDVLRNFDVAQCPTHESEEKRRLSVRDPWNSEVSFEALSYTWGGTVGTKKIVLNGFPFLVTQNLWDALNHLRFRRIPRTMWIDSLCINQEDVLERSSQVQLMPRIYQSASRTVIWLGETTIPEPAVVFCGLSDEVYSFEDQGGKREEFEKDMKIRWKIYQYQQSFWSTVPSLFSLAWWSRIWTIQEAGVAKSATIRAGRFEISFAALIEATLPQLSGDLEYHRERRGDIRLRLKITEACDHYRSATEWQRDRGEKRGRASLLSLVTKHRKKGATDPRDKIYALLGMAMDGRFLVSDYGLSVHDLYVMFATMVITGKLSTTGFLSDPRGFFPLDIILFGRDNSGPSWVPQWDRDWEGCAYPLSVHLRDTRDFMSPSGDGWNAHNNTIAAADIYGFHRHILKAGGVEVDVIIEVGELCPSTPGSETFECVTTCISTWGNLLIRHFGNDIAHVISTVFKRISHYSQSVGLYLDMEEEEGIIFMDRLARVGGNVPKNKRLEALLIPPIEYIGGQSIPEAWIRTLMIDRTVRFLRLRPDDVLAFLEGRLFDQGKVDQLGTFSQLLLETIHQNLSRRRLFITEKGYMGLAPESTMVGDHVVVLRGCSIPLIFRHESFTGLECKWTETQGRLIGECYVHGIMDGEAVQMAERGVLNILDFIIH